VGAERLLSYFQHRAVDGQSSPLRSALRTYTMHLTRRSQESAAVSVVGLLLTFSFPGPSSIILVLPNEHVELY